MGIIRLLDENTINKIAAGEVVNRPASVVKELVENAIDAKATNIKIELQEGGKSLIKVSDNGTGMDCEDAKMSLIRHATSKISNVEDLLFLDSMGFRGEAIPSIASVSRFTIQTNLKDQEKGIEIITESGKIITETTLYLPKGTTIIVKDLFFNIPARQKYLKGESTEFGHILKIIHGLSLVHPEIAFQLFNNNKKISATTGNNKIEEVISDIHSFKVFQNMLQINYSDLGIKINGYISTPKETKANKEKQLFVVNKRMVNNNTFHAAIAQSTKFIFPNNMYPYLFLNIETDPSEIDVNVHPSKTEIKLYKESFIFDSIFKAIKKTFQSSSEHEIPTEIIEQQQYKNEIKTFPKQNQITYKPTELFENKQQIEMYKEIIKEAPIVSSTRKAVNNESSITVNNIFQFKDMYLVFYYDNKLRIIDQHAAHERILFERLKSGNTTKGSQELLFPENIFIDQQDYIIFEEIKAIIETTGYIIETFGNDSLIIRCVPTDLPSNTDHKELIKEIIDDNRKDSKDRITKTYTTIACKAAIKAGDFLEEREKISLVNDWLNCDNNISCPHGRPIEKTFDEKEIDKWFHRG